MQDRCSTWFVLMKNLYDWKLKPNVSVLLVSPMSGGEISAILNQFAMFKAILRSRVILHLRHLYPEIKYILLWERKVKPSLFMLFACAMSGIELNATRNQFGILKDIYYDYELFCIWGSVIPPIGLTGAYYTLVRETCTTSLLSTSKYSCTVPITSLLV